MTNYIIFLTFFFNLLFAQFYKVVPSIIEKDGIAFKINDEIPYTGKITVFWEDNKLKEEGIYREGVKSGLWKYWYDSGQLFSKGIYRNNLQTGVWLEWYKNGNKKIQTIYRNGLKNGKQISWSSDGVKVS